MIKVKQVKFLRDSTQISKGIATQMQSLRPGDDGLESKKLNQKPIFNLKEKIQFFQA
jgi:hypothetical protein